MSAVTRPRGPLPPRVYWVRRTLVLVLLLVLVVLVWGIARLVGGGGEDGSTSASPVAATREPSTTPLMSEPPSTPEPAPTAEREDEREDKRPAKPSGPCLDSDVVVTPDVVGPYVGHPEVVLQVSTVESEACTWEVSPDSVFVEISDDKGPLWSSQDCPVAIPTEEVVARREQPAEVAIAWNGKQSDRDCSEATDWVPRGEYVVKAIASGSVTPVEVGFVLTRQVVEVPPSEEPSDKPSEDGSAQDGSGEDGSTDEPAGRQRDR